MRRTHHELGLACVIIPCIFDFRTRSVREIVVNVVLEILIDVEDDNTVTHEYEASIRPNDNHQRPSHIRFDPMSTYHGV